MGTDQEVSELNEHIRHSLQKQVRLYLTILSAQTRSGLFWAELEEWEEEEAEAEAEEEVVAVCVLWLQA